MNSILTRVRKNLLYYIQITSTCTVHCPDEQSDLDYCPDRLRGRTTDPSNAEMRGEKGMLLLLLLLGLISALEAGVSGCSIQKPAGLCWV